MKACRSRWPGRQILFALTKRAASCRILELVIHYGVDMHKDARAEVKTPPTEFVGLPIC